MGKLKFKVVIAFLRRHRRENFHQWLYPKLWRSICISSRRKREHDVMSFNLALQDAPSSAVTRTTTSDRIMRPTTHDLAHTTHGQPQPSAVFSGTEPEGMYEYHRVRSRLQINIGCRCRYNIHARPKTFRLDVSWSLNATKFLYEKLKK